MPWTFCHLCLPEAVRGLVRSALHSFRIGVPTANPSGLRGKEPILAGLGPGIWCLSNRSTVTSAYTAQLRVNSAWAGSWSGVLTLSDWPSRPLSIAMQPGVYETGRIHLVQYVVNGLPLLTTNLYGYASGQTHVAPLQLTDQLLEPVTLEVVLGRKGPRIICGDFNHPAGQLSQVQVWKVQGWVEAQELALSRWQCPILPTCKGATVRDYVFLSPEAAALCTAVQVSNVFMEHSLVTAVLAVPSALKPVSVWPMPGEIPWQEVDVPQWHSSSQLPAPQASDSTIWYRQVCRVT